MKKVLFIPDQHVPYHDKKAFELLLRAGRALKPHVIAVLGDFADFYSVSAHSKDPNRSAHLEDEVQAVNACLSKLDALGAKEKVYVAGNHENRLERYLQDKAPELFNVVKIPDLLQLKQRKWRYVPYKQHYKLGKFHLTHDVGHSGKGAVSQNLAAFQDNVIAGHTHRLGVVVEGNVKGVPHLSATFGWGGDVNKVDYMHMAKCKRDWAHGFGSGYLMPNGVIHIVPHPIVNYTVVVEGKLITL